MRDAQNLAGTGSNPNLAVPLVQPLERTASELVAGGADADAGEGEGADGLSNEESEEIEGRNKLLLTPRRPLTPSEAHQPGLSVDTAPSSPEGGGSARGLGLGLGSSREHGSRRGSATFGAPLPPNVSVVSPVSAGGGAGVHLPPPPTFTLSPLQAEPPIFAVATATAAAAETADTHAPASSPPMLSATVADHIGPAIPAQRPQSSSSSRRTSQGGGFATVLGARTPAGVDMGARFSGFEDGFEALLLQGAAQLSTSDTHAQPRLQLQPSRPASPSAAAFVSPFARTNLRPHPAPFSRSDADIDAPVAIAQAADPDHDHGDGEGAVSTDHKGTLRHRRKDPDGSNSKTQQAEHKER